MATPDRILQLKLVTDTTAVSKGMKTVQKDMTKVQKAQGRLKSGFKGMGAALAGVFAVSAGVDWLKGGIEAAVEAERITKSLERTVGGVSRNVERDMERIDKAASQALGVGFDDEDFMQSLDGLIQRTRVGVPRGLQIMGVALNVAAAKGFDKLEPAVRLVERALQGNKRALRELGVPLRLAGNKIGTLRWIMRHFAGAARGAADTAAGRWKNFELQLGEVQQTAGGYFLNLLDFSSNAVSGITGDQDKLKSTTASTVGFLATEALALQAGAQKVAGIWDPVSTAWDIGLGKLVDIVTGHTDAIQEDVRATQETINAISIALFRKKIEDEVAAAKRALRGLPTTAASIAARLEAIWRTWEIGGIFGGVARGLHWPHLAEGGIVTRPTLAMVGERGPEAVVPLSGSGAAGFGNVTVNIVTGVGDPVEIGRQVDRVLRAYRTRAGLAA